MALINKLIKLYNMLEGKKSIYYTEVKSKIIAGMKFSKLMHVGNKTVRIYFDSELKDCTIGQETIKTVFFDTPKKINYKKF